MGFSITVEGGSLFVISDLNEQKPLGTGFCFIKPTWVVTAKHVVFDEQIGGKSIARSNLKLSSCSGLREISHASILFTHPHHDLAVLELHTPSPCKKPLFPGHEGFTGKKGLVFCGYSPSKSKSPNEGTILVDWIKTYEREHRSWIDREEHLINFEAPYGEGGNSGGPIFGEGGGVVAVSTQLYYNEDKQYRIRATSIIPLLDYLIFKT